MLDIFPVGNEALKSGEMPRLPQMASTDWLSQVLFAGINNGSIEGVCMAKLRPFTLSIL